MSRGQLSLTILTNQIPSFELKNYYFVFCRYSVFALGSRNYPTFCAFGHYVDDHLRELGGQSILTIGEGDELNGQDESFREWAKNAIKVL